MEDIDNFSYFTYMPIGQLANVSALRLPEALDWSNFKISNKPTWPYRAQSDFGGSII